MRAELKTKKRVAAQRARRVRTSTRGTSERPRMSVFRSNRNYYVQLIDDQTGTTVAAASTADAKIEGVEQLGTEIATRAKKAGITKVVFDRGSLAYGGNLAKLADAARAGGLDF